MIFLSRTFRCNSSSLFSRYSIILLPNLFCGTFAIATVKRTFLTPWNSCKIHISTKSITSNILDDLLVEGFNFNVESYRVVEPLASEVALKLLLNVVNLSTNLIRQRQRARGCYYLYCAVVIAALSSDLVVHAHIFNRPIHKKFFVQLQLTLQLHTCVILMREGLACNA